MPTFIRSAESGIKRNPRALFLCHGCGTTFETYTASVRKGDTASCGCYRRAATKANKTRHGQAPKGAQSRTYQSWLNMVRRCHDPRCPTFPRYGGMGIFVCDRWKDNFSSFLEDMGECPPGKTIDRWPNKNGPYEKSNCRWATQIEQQRNRTNNRLFEFRGELLTAGEIKEKSGTPIERHRILCRLLRGWDVNRAIGASI